MRGITIKLDEATLRDLKEEARATGRSVAAIVRERIATLPRGEARSVHALAGDLAGCLAGSSAPATNSRRKFRRS